MSTSGRFEGFLRWEDVISFVQRRGEAWIVMPGAGNPYRFGASVGNGSVHAGASGGYRPQSYGAETLHRFRREKSAGLSEGERIDVPVVGSDDASLLARAKVEIEGWSEQEAREFKRELFMRISVLSAGKEDPAVIWIRVRRAWELKPEDC